MIIKFDEIKETELKAFYGGDGALIANMYVDEKNKILRGKLVPGATIGLHKHLPSSEIIFILFSKSCLILLPFNDIWGKYVYKFIIFFISCTFWKN